MDPKPSKLNTILFAIMFILSLPTGAILVSNNAVPGDGLYSVKLALENIASFIISPSYATNSDLQIKLLERRIEENQQLLLSSGSTEGLSFLVAQAESAKDFIIKSNASPEIKRQAVKKLVTTLRASQQAISSPQAPEKYQANPTISQGNTHENTPSNYQPSTPTPNSPTNTTPTTETPPSLTTPQSDEEIADTTEQIDDIIEEVENVVEIIPTPTPLPTQEPTPEPTQTTTESDSNSSSGEEGADEDQPEAEDENPPGNNSGPGSQNGNGNSGNNPGN